VAQMSEYSIPELLATAVSRELPDGGLGFIGLGTGGRAFTFAVGVPTVAIELAHRRGVDFIAQYGVMFEPKIDELPESFADPYLLKWQSKAQIPVETALDMFKRGMMNIGFISAAQIDSYGNTNTVVIGPQNKPKIRLVGGIAAPDHASNAEHTIILMSHERRTFVEKVDFLSALGFGDGPDARRRLGVRGKGPKRVFTDLAVLGFDEATKRMRVESLHPGVTRGEVEEKTGFELGWDKEVATTPAPTAEELSLIRQHIDPQKLLMEGRII
jgi:glutaconate CoA-transferase, subunit B